MTNTEKDEKLRKFDPKQCPICGALTFLVYHMQTKEELSHYWHCRCGVVFQEKCPEIVVENIYNEKYVESYIGMGNKYINAVKYPVRLYAPLIEELTYGRKMLDVGFLSHFFMQEMSKRGWLTWGIDFVHGVSDSERIIKGNFETHDFKDQKFNLIWMSHVFEHFKSPKNIIKKCYDLMPEDGVLYIATPDTDFIHTRSNSGFTHWRRDEHYIMWSKEALTRELEKAGFDVVMVRRNYEIRFTSWDDIQIIAQKRFF